MANPLLTKVSDIVGAVFMPAANELGQSLGDRARLWRLKNLTSILERAERIVRDRGVPIDQAKKLPFGDLMRIAEAASREDDDDVQGLWAGLIANLVEGKNGSKANKTYISILSELTSPGVAFLEIVFKFEGRLERISAAKAKELMAEFESEAKKHWRVFDSAERQVALQDLMRLRCIAVKPPRRWQRALFAELPESAKQFSGQRWSAVNGRALEEVLNDLSNAISVDAGLATAPERSATRSLSLGSLGVTIPEMGYVLTPLGKALLTACHQPS